MDIRIAIVAAVVAGVLMAAGMVRAAEGKGGHLRISGIYPHMAAFNQPESGPDSSHGEAGTGAIAPWAGKLWFLTYPQHKTTGSNDKLYEVSPDFSVTVRPESVGGTHAGRMIHRESKQLILGPYFIDEKGRVRAADLHKLRGRMTAVMRHLTDPANMVYFFDMEGALYEVNVHTLAVKKLFSKTAPGVHGKGGYTAQGRVVISNNGERGRPDKKDPEAAGALAEWHGEGSEWQVVERRQFTDVTGPGDIYGNPDGNAPLWAIGWDKRSVLLMLLDGGKWYRFRTPKGTHAMDPRHGWFTEWPRIREIAPDRPMMCMHAGMYAFPQGFSAADTSGIRPICTHLRYIPDFCHWQGKVVLGADDAAMMGNPLCGQAQSNLWFGEIGELDHFGPRAGWGGVWRGDDVPADTPSDPYLLAGFDQRIVHLSHKCPKPVNFEIQIDRAGTGEWTTHKTIEVPAKGYGWHVFDKDTPGEWVRVKLDKACPATVYFHYWSPRPAAGNEDAIFSGLADAGSPSGYVGGVIRPAAHNRSLQWVPRPVGPEGKASKGTYREVVLEGTSALAFTEPDTPDQAARCRKIAQLSKPFEVDEASIILKAGGKRYRLPKGHAAYDQPFPTGWPRGIREAVSERYLANFHGTFYEIPRGGGHRPDIQRIRPVASHGKIIADFCTWRGLLVLSGAKAPAKPDGHCFAGEDARGLWFGAIDDLWKLGKPVGRGGPWHETAVKAGETSDPYLMTGYDRKTLRLSHDADVPVTFTLEADISHENYRPVERIGVPAGKTVTWRFPDGYHAHWARLTADKACRATATFIYE